MIEVIQKQRTTKTNFVKYECVHTQNLTLHRKNDKNWIKILLGPIIQKASSFQSICSSGLAVCCPRHIEADGILVPKKRPMI